MRAFDFILVEKLVPNKWVPEKAEPAVSPTSKFDKALPLYNPQQPSPVPPEAALAQSLGQLAQIDAQQLGIEAQELQQQATAQPQPSMVAEKMMPAGMFAGSDKNKLGPAGQAKGKQKGPVKRGQLVGGAAESMREDQDPAAPPAADDQSDDYINKVSSAATSTAGQRDDVDPNQEQSAIGWVVQKAFEPVPDSVSSTLGLPKGYTYGEAVLDGWTAVDLALMATGIGTAIGAPMMAGAQAAKLAMKQGAKIAAKQGAKAAGKEAVVQGEKAAAKQGVKDVIGGAVNSLFGNNQTAMPMSNPIQQSQQANKKNKLGRGQNIAVPINGKIYTLPIVDVSDTAYTVDASSITGDPPGSKTMQVPA
jgi:hypothetical protein